MAAVIADHVAPRNADFSIAVFRRRQSRNVSFQHCAAFYLAGRLCDVLWRGRYSPPHPVTLSQHTVSVFFRRIQPMSHPTDIEIARAASKMPIQDIGAKLGISANDLVPFGHDKAKVSAEFIACAGGS
jgi:hypothetical protein